MRVKWDHLNAMRALYQRFPETPRALLGGCVSAFEGPPTSLADEGVDKLLLFRTLAVFAGVTTTVTGGVMTCHENAPNDDFISS